jgi:exodeoxyribonuclease-3
MKIITWNCGGAFRKKAHAILDFEPDILLIPECECLEKLAFKPAVKEASSMLWFGGNLNKGLAVFAYNGLQLTPMDGHNSQIKIIAPIAVTGGEFDFTLFAIWTNNPDDPDGTYIEQVWKAIHHYDSLIKPERTVLAGDFNSNTIWDRPRRAGNHSNVVKSLEEKGIYSAYHFHHTQQQGKEQHPTFYFHKHLEKPYHIDYCFVSADIAAALQTVEIGEHSVWSALSDHVPVIVTFRS